MISKWNYTTWKIQEVFSIYHSLEIFEGIFYLIVTYYFLTLGYIAISVRVSNIYNLIDHMYH